MRTGCEGVSLAVSARKWSDSDGNAEKDDTLAEHHLSSCTGTIRLTAHGEPLHVECPE